MMHLEILLRRVMKGVMKGVIIGIQSVYFLVITIRNIEGLDHNNLMARRGLSTRNYDE
jgi:hypothetical protein